MCYPVLMFQSVRREVIRSLYVRHCLAAVSVDPSWNLEKKGVGPSGIVFAVDMHDLDSRLLAEVCAWDSAYGFPAKNGIRLFHFNNLYSSGWVMEHPTISHGENSPTLLNTKEVVGRLRSSSLFIDAVAEKKKLELDRHHAKLLCELRDLEAAISIKKEEIAAFLSSS